MSCNNNNNINNNTLVQRTCAFVIFMQTDITDIDTIEDRSFKEGTVLKLIQINKRELVQIKMDLNRKSDK